MSPLPSAQVLLLEKDGTNRMLFAEYLEQCGYSVFQLSDEREVFESLESCRPDVLVLNLKMPAIDGFTIIEQVRAHVLWRSLPILVVTGYTLTKYQRRAYQLGANAYLTKPMAPDALSAAIAQLVTQSSSRLANDLSNSLADSFAKNRYAPAESLIA
ncbi:MAG: hypothetical protein DCF25_00370 [Leptolyngbya foveolarum]|uniref:Response regulatory domain-containing protein n=1 Tax=Leptolyngbya foveolarum TaxID=47253 RepID=A0A2W4WMG6_9CYAN|nr:MAG: hypothetical protein DCF25_00370 [Leptolyngbya foveolarum]